jgi:signal transduction histidine kinase
VAVATDLGSLIQNLLSLLRYQSPPAVHLDQRIDEGLECVVPPGRIRQAVLNLVVNSFQALDGSPGTVTILAERREDMLHLEVRDDGPGFPEDLLSTAGQHFRTGRDSGTGLGLATVQRTATDLGGSLTFENLVPRGASVVLSLPCQFPMGSRKEIAQQTIDTAAE